MYMGKLSGIAFFVLLGCGGAVEDASIQHATGGYTTQLVTGGTSSVEPIGSGGASTGGQMHSTYPDQGCPDASAGPTVTEYCDLFGTNTGCEPGQGCFPMVRSSEDPCQPAEYFFVCVTAGTAKQAEKCEANARCAAGHVCVVTNTGTQCQQVCNTSDASGCAPGMFCDPIDVPGVGTCS
jgi:hypothetical protein